MAGNNLGTAWIQIKPTTSGITSAVKKELSNVEKEMTGSGSKLTGAFSNLGQKAGQALKVGLMAVGTAAVGGAVALVKNAVSEFANYEQLVGGVDTLFKESSKQVQEYAANAYKTAGLSANEYMEQATSFSARLIRDTGGDTEKAAKLADMAITDMADNANKMGTSIELIQNAYEGLSKGNATMLDNLKVGYSGTQKEMLQLAKDMGVVDESVKSFADMSFEESILAIHKVQEELDITGTTAEEASNTISGSMGSMKSAWENLLVGLADDDADMGKLVDNFIDTAETALKNLLPVILNSLEGIGELINELAPIIIEKLPGLIQTLLPQFINVVVQLANAIIKNLPMILTTLLQGLVSALPSLVQGIVDTLPVLIDAIVQFLTNPENIMIIIQAAVQLFMALVMAVPQIIGALFGAFGKLFSGLWDLMKEKFGQFAAAFGDFIGGIFKGAINAVISFIEGFINTPIDIINGFLDIINGAFGWLGVNIGKIDRVQLPRLYTGGIVEGVGTDTSDSNLYALSKGEYVIRAAAAREIGYDNLNRMNETGEVSNGSVVNITINGYNRDPEQFFY